DLEAVEIHEDQHRFPPGDARALQRLRQPDVEPAVVVEPRQIVLLRQLVGALGIERVLQREGGVAGEDLQQGHVAAREDLAIEPVDQLQHAADVLADVDRHADDRVGLVPDLLVDVRIEELVLLHVRGEVRRTGLIDLPDDPVLGRKPLPDQLTAGIAEGGDEDELVLAPLRELAKRVVEEDGARLGRDELVRFLENLAQDEIEVDFAFEREAGLLALEEPFELRDLEGMELDHPIASLCRQTLDYTCSSAAIASISNEMFRYASAAGIPLRRLRIHST